MTMVGVASAKHSLAFIDFMDLTNSNREANKHGLNVVARSNFDGS
jgi:hypothetical protein